MVRKLKYGLYATGISLALLGCGGTTSEATNNENEENENSGVVKVESISGFEIPESVARDGNILYVSNVNSRESRNPWIDNGGYISKITKVGIGEGSSTIKSMKWATGLKAPKGIAFSDEELFVCDLDRIAVISRETGEIINSLDAPEGITHLNDIVFDSRGDSAVYVTDSRTDQIWKVTEAEGWSLFYDAEPMPAHSNQNGLYLDGDKLIMQAEVGKLKSIDINTKEVNVIASNLCGDSSFKIDGIAKVDNKYLVSTWPAKICMIPKNGGLTEVLNTIEEGPAAADISISDSLEALLVPDFDSEIDIYVK
jgi:hypothetical protein